MFATTWESSKRQLWYGSEGNQAEERMCWCAGGRGRQSNKVRVPETGDLVREVKRVQAPRLAELTAL
jgi:hypothetical protein